MDRPFLIAIAGASCSGKSSVARELAGLLESTTVIGLDSYYRDLSRVEVAARAKTNFDHPDAVDLDLLLRDIATLCAGGAVHPPVYDFASHTRRIGREIALPKSANYIVEGLWVLHWPSLRHQFDLKVFLEAPNAICLDRRTRRDVRERGRTLHSVLTQYQETVLPMSEQYVLPTRDFADLIVDGEDSLPASAHAILEKALQMRYLGRPQSS